MDIFVTVCIPPPPPSREDMGGGTTRHTLGSSKFSYEGVNKQKHRKGREIVQRGRGREKEIVKRGRGRDCKKE